VFTTTCSQANVLQLTRRLVNGPDTKTSGFDVRGQYDFPNFFGMDFHEAQVTVGAEATILKEFKRSAFKLDGDSSVLLSAAIDRAGLHDLGGGDFYSYPKLRANAFVNVHGSNWNLRYQLLYRSGTKNIGATCLGDASAGLTPDCRYNYATGVYQSVGRTEAYWQHDVTASLNLPWDTTLTGSIQNLLDTDPPFAQSFYNYDLTNGNPLGRVFKLGVKKKF
jgi:iron complex outermembrane receptor protein